MKQRNDWTYRFTPGDLDEIEAAARQVLDRGLGILEITKSAFPLPSLDAKLAALQRDVVEGRGFVFLKGIPATRLDRLTLAVIYWGIGLRFGDPVSQNAKGHLLGHVKDLGLPPHDLNRRGYQTTLGLDYHTDGCDIVGLMCLAKAKAGGLSAIASAGAIHNEILRLRPDLLDVLYQPFHISRVGDIPVGKLPWYCVSIFNQYQGYLTSMYPGGDIRKAQRLPEVPRLTPKQAEAMHLVDALAEEYSLRMDIEPGDMQFLHNHTIYHARTEFEDHPEQERKRHMLRLWLSAPNGRPLPPEFAERYGNIEAGTVRGGIICEGTTFKAPLEAE